MAYTLDGNTQYFTAAAPFHAAAAYTACVWVNIASLSTQQKMLAVCNDTGSNFEWLITTSSSALLVAHHHGSGLVTPSGGTITAGVWNHIGIRWDGSTVEGFINGVSVCSASEGSASNTTSALLSIGAGTNGSSPANPMGGGICEVALWNTALGTSEIASLAARFSARTIRPQSLQFYAPLVRELVDMRGGDAITANAAPSVSDHPPVIGW